MRTHDNPLRFNAPTCRGFDELVKAIIRIVVEDGPTCLNYFEKERQYPKRCFTIKITTPAEFKPASKAISHLLLDSSLLQAEKVRSTLGLIENELRERDKIPNAPRPIVIIPFPHDGSFERGLRQLLKEDKTFDVFCVDLGSFKVRFLRFSNALIHD